MAFSGALTLTDLNDFITPAQTCIKPVEQVNKPPEREKGAAETEIQIDGAGGYYEVPVNGANSSANGTTGSSDGKKLVQAEVSLADCLACSGCITSAESVLITLQSHSEVLNFLADNTIKLDPNVTVLSIAPQSLASIAASLAARLTSSHPNGNGSSASTTVTPRQILRRARYLCTTVLGFDHVLDVTFARHLSLMDHIQEYEERRKKHEEGERHQLPMLASSCPGWVCYAEKAHPEMLPFISQTKSPQQVMGSLVKNWLGGRWQRSPNQIYHVTVMPCYDKKLEASRSDFYNDVYSTREVDCVITTGELEKMLIEKGCDISLPVPGEEDEDEEDEQSSAVTIVSHPHRHREEEHAEPASKVTGNNQLLNKDLPNGSISDHGSSKSCNKCSSASCNSKSSQSNSSSLATSTPPDTDPIYLPELLTHPGTSSGSYLHTLLAHQILTSPVPLHLTHRTIRNADYEEFVLADANGRVAFRGAKCYGFRNLQNVVRKVGRDTGVRVGKGAAGKLKARNTPRSTSDSSSVKDGSTGAAGGIRARVAARKQKKAAEAAAAAGGASNGDLSVALDGGREGYDYIEVMACPGGCVNGGGQLKPPLQVTSATVASTTGDGGAEAEALVTTTNTTPSSQAISKDEDGYQRDWARGGAQPLPETEEVTMAEAVLQNAKWGDKEWTKRVEAVYWGGEGTAPSPPPLTQQPQQNGSVPMPAPASVSAPAPASTPSSLLSSQIRRADELAKRVIEEVSKGSVTSKGMDRKGFLRTQYHAVESEVIGLAVKW